MSTVVYGGFEWDSAKAIANSNKHGVSFVEAASVFGDPDAFYFDNGSSEGRIAVIGFSHNARLLLVVHVDVGTDEEPRLRIISARKPTREEEALY